MNIDPRFDVVRPFDIPGHVMVTATGVINGQLYMTGVSVAPSGDELQWGPDQWISSVLPMLSDAWAAKMMGKEGHADWTDAEHEEHAKLNTHIYQRWVALRSPPGEKRPAKEQKAPDGQQATETQA